MTQHDIKVWLFRRVPVRVLAGAFHLLRGILLRPFDAYRSMVDLCWVQRVSGIPILSKLAYRSICRFIFPVDPGEGRLVRAFLRSSAAAATKRRFLGARGDMESMFRDMLILKAPSADEKGALVLEYSQKFDLFVSLFDLKRIMKDYRIVLEPCWAGYCDPSILMFVSSLGQVVVQCPEDADFRFIAGLNSNLLPVRLGSSDWIDPDLFAPSDPPSAKEFDLVMVANWAKHKNHARLFHALQLLRHRRLTLLLIGVDWGGRTDADIRAEMARFQLGHVETTILKDITARQVASYLERSKVFLLLSEKEGSNRAIVEALMCNVPAILYENFVGGARNKINQQTGILSSFSELHQKIEFMLDNHQRFSPRRWALAHTGSKNATRILNEMLRGIAATSGQAWTTDIVEKVNNPNFCYKRPGAIPVGQAARSVAHLYLR